MACLHKALAEKRYKYVTLNLDWGENPNYRDSEGKTLLMKLASFERDTKWLVATVKRLLKLPKAKDLVDNDGRDILMTCIRHRKIGMAKLILYEPDFDISKVDKCGYTALHYSSEIGLLPITTILCQTMYRYGINIDCTTPTGMTALMLSCQNGHVDCARVLINEGKACLSMKDDVHFKGPRDWLQDVYNVYDGLDPFADGVVLSRKDDTVKGRNVSFQLQTRMTSRPRTQSTNSTLVPQTFIANAQATSTSRLESEEGGFTYSAISPVKHPVGSQPRPRYLLNPTIIFEDSTGHIFKPKPELDCSSSLGESYMPVLYKLFTVSSIQITPSFRPPVRKPKTPSPEPEPEPEIEPEPHRTTDEEDEPEQQNQSARSKLKKAMKFRKAENLIESLKKGPKKGSGTEGQKNIRSLNINQLMANLKKKQAKAEPATTVHNLDKLKEKFGKFRRVTSQHTPPSVRSTSLESNLSDSSGTSVNIRSESVIRKDLLKPE